MPSVLDLEFSSKGECPLGFHDSQCSVGCKFSGFGNFYFLSSFSYSTTTTTKNLRGKRVCGSRGHKSLVLKALATRPESSLDYRPSNGIFESLVYPVSLFILILPIPVSLWLRVNVTWTVAG